MPKIDDDDTRKIADYLAKSNRVADFGETSKLTISVKTACACAIPIAIALIWCGATWARINNMVDITYLQAWNYEAEKLNPGWHAPNPYLIRQQLK